VTTAYLDLVTAGYLDPVTAGYLDPVTAGYLDPVTLRPVTGALGQSGAGPSPLRSIR
jgi:hypothetical protein